MSARRIRSLVILATAAAALALPAAALAGNPSDSLSATDSIAADVSVDGSNDSSAATESEASDSPTTDVYGSTETIPPPVTTEECDSVGGISDSSGNECEPVTTTVTETPVVEGGGEVPVEEPIIAEPVAGGGMPVPVVAAEVAGGGGPELPFTGLPLWYAIYGGIGLMVLGSAFWLRARAAGRNG